MFRLYQRLRQQLLGLLVDDDLVFRVAPMCPTLGALCHEIGRVEQSYIDSFANWRQEFAPPTIDAAEQSVAALTAWYADLDAGLEAAVEQISESDLAQRTIDRGDGFLVSPKQQLDIYKEALLIFYGKAHLYLLALGKSLPHQWQEWIG